MQKYRFNITPDEEGPFRVHYRGTGFIEIRYLLNGLLVNGRPVWTPGWNGRLAVVASEGGELVWSVPDIRITCRLSLKRRRRLGVCWYLEVQLYWAEDSEEPEVRPASYVSRNLLHPANRAVMYAHVRRIKAMVDRLGGPAGWQPALGLWSVKKFGHVVVGYVTHDDPVHADAGNPYKYTGFAAIPGIRTIVSRSRYTNELLDQLVKDLVGPRPSTEIARIRGWIKRVKKYDTLVAGLIREAACAG
jgi:hypothetical protein